MNRELIEYIQQEIKEAQDYFKSDEQFDEVFEQAGWNGEEMRIFDCGFVKGLQNALSKLQEYSDE